MSYNSKTIGLNMNCRSLLLAFVLFITLPYTIWPDDNSMQNGGISGDLRQKSDDRGDFQGKKPDIMFLGFGITTFSGSGLAFLYRFSAENRIKSHVFYLQESSSYMKSFGTFYGFEWQRNLHKGKSMRFYYLIGLSMILSFEMDRLNSNEYKFNGNFLTGPGFGIEFYITEKTTLSFSFGTQFFKDLKARTFGIFPGIGFDIMYGFF